MQLVKEPLDVDFYCPGQQMIEEDHKRVSAFFKKNAGRKQRSRRVKNLD